MTNRRRHRKDGTHDEVKETLEAMGYHVIDTSQTNLGFDLIVVKHGRMTPVEVKDGSLSPSRQKLTEHEAKVHADLKKHGITVEILTGPDQSLEVLGRVSLNMYDKERA